MGYRKEDAGFVDRWDKRGIRSTSEAGEWREEVGDRDREYIELEGADSRREVGERWEGRELFFFQAEDDIRD